MKLFRGNSIASLGLVLKCVVAIDVDLTDADSIKNAAATIAFDMMTYYTGNISGSQNWQGSPGILQLPFGANGGYYWWEAGGMWGAMIDYWYYTGDTSYNDVVSEGIVFQSNAPDNNFMVANQTSSMGNDDEGFWGMTAMTAAEVNFPPPPVDSQIPGWLALAQGTFNTIGARWDDTLCGGGFRWQAFSQESGYTYKNSISNGVFFNIGARLALYTGNETYYDLANRTYTWMATIGLLDESIWAVYDGSDDTINCTQIDHDRWTYNVGIFLHGAANMYNYTSSLNSSDPRAADAALWKARVTGLGGLSGTAGNGLNYFFQNGVMFEVCEATGNCDSDRKSFKAYLSRWMAATTKLAPFTSQYLLGLISSSATAAAQQCDGGVNAINTGSGRQCGLRWTMGSTYDGDTGVGQQMAALEIIQGNLILQTADTVTNTTGGTSQGDPAAGTTGTQLGPNGLPPIIVTSSDRVGAGFITFFTVVFVIGACWWLVSPERLSDSPGQMVNKTGKKDWGWGDLSMGARMARKQFTQKGFANRDSMVLEKLKGASNSGMMGGGDRDSALSYGAGGLRSDGSTSDIYGGNGIPFASGNVSHPGSGTPIYSAVGGNGSGLVLPGGNGSRPDVGAYGGNDSRPGSSRGPLQDGGVIHGHPVA